MVVRHGRCGRPHLRQQQHLAEMGILRRFMENHEFHTLEPRQDLILDGPAHGAAKIRAARASDGSRIVVYSPRGEPFTLDLGELVGGMHTQTWFDPRYGSDYRFRTEQSQGIQSFVPPSSGDGEDWVLVLESEAARATAQMAAQTQKVPA